MELGGRGGGRGVKYDQLGTLRYYSRHPSANQSNVHGVTGELRMHPLWDDSQTVDVTQTDLNDTQAERESSSS